MMPIHRLRRFAALTLGVTMTAGGTDGYVRTGTSANWAEILEAPVNLVEFYAPWSGYAKSLKTEYAKAAETLSTTMKCSGIQLVSVDGTVEKKLVKKYGVTSYPTITVLESSGPVIEEYAGGRTADTIVSWMLDKYEGVC